MSPVNELRQCISLIDMFEREGRHKIEKSRTHKSFVPPGSHLKVREQQWKLLTPGKKVSKISAVDKGVPKAMAFMKKTTLNRQVKLASVKMKRIYQTSTVETLYRI